MCRPNSSSFNTTRQGGFFALSSLRPLSFSQFSHKSPSRTDWAGGSVYSLRERPNIVRLNLYQLSVVAHSFHPNAIINMRVVIAIALLLAAADAADHQAPEDQCIGFNKHSCCMEKLNGKDGAEEVCKTHNCAEDACIDFDGGGGGGSINSGMNVLSKSKPARKVSI